MIDGFRHERAGHCGSGALRDLLEFHGLSYFDRPISEGEAFGLGGGLGAFYGEFGDQIYLVGRTGELERDIAPILGAGLDVRATDDPDEGWAWVASEVDAGRPPMVWADIAKLDYLRVRMSNTRHDVLVVGYDDDVAWIADNDRDELQPCARSSLAAARSSDGFPGPNRHTTFVYDWPAELPPREVAVPRAVARAVANMRTDPDAVGGLPGAVGLDAIDAFCDSYPTWPDRFGDSVLPLLSVFIVKAGTGGAMFRSLHRDFCASFGLTEAARIYSELTDAWVALAGFARAGDHAAGLDLVTSIRQLEHAGVTAMEDYNRSAPPT